MSALLDPTAVLDPYNGASGPEAFDCSNWRLRGGLPQRTREGISDRAHRLHAARRHQHARARRARPLHPLPCAVERAAHRSAAAVLPCAFPNLVQPALPAARTAPRHLSGAILTPWLSGGGEGRATRAAVSRFWM